MRCGNCNGELKDGAKFCPFCGQPVDQSTPNSASGAGNGYQQPINPNSSYQNGGNFGNPNGYGVSNNQYANPNNYGNQYAYTGENGKKGAGFGIASMVLGIVALVCGCCLWYISLPCALVGLALGAVSLKGNRDGRGMAIAGVVCSIISLVPTIIIIITGTSLMAGASAGMF